VVVSADIPEAVRKAVEARSGGVCEACGRARATEKHHRLFRSQGGLHTVENLLDLCGWGNHTGDHGVAHTKAGFEKGWSVRSGDDPAEIPVEHALFGRVLLTADGAWKPVGDGSGHDDTRLWETPFSGATKVAAWRLS